MFRSLLIVVFLFCGVSRAADLGTIAFMKDNAVYVSESSSNASRRIPNSEGTFIVSLSPGGKYLVFFTGSSQNPTGFFCKSPFLTCQKLKFPSKVVYGLIWSGTGDQFYLGQQYKSILLKLPGLQTKNFNFFPNSISSDGLVLTYSTVSEIRVQNAGKERTVFSIPASANPLNWAFGGISVSRDGKNLYFASNSGKGIDEFGTTRWRWYVANTSGGTPKALKMPEFTGRIPDSVEISSDNQKMVFGYSNKENSFLHLINLKAQNELRTMAQNTNGSLSGTFSPDSSLIAVGASSLKDGALQSKVNIMNLVGVVVRSIPGASQCTW